MRVYSTASDSWSAGVSLPLPRRGADYCLGTDNMIHILGGYNTAQTNTAYRYDLASSSWNTLSSIPVPLFEAGAARYISIRLRLSCFARAPRSLLPPTSSAQAQALAISGIKMGDANRMTTANYTSAALANGDTIQMRLTSSGACPAVTTVLSNKVSLTVSSVVNPTLAITANPAGPVAAGIRSPLVRCKAAAAGSGLSVRLKTMICI